VGQLHLRVLLKIDRVVAEALERLELKGNQPSLEEGEMVFNLLFLEVLFIMLEVGELLRGIQVLQEQEV
jgi:hypothetical protein